MTQNSLILGNWNALCDSCGRRFKASEMQKRWDGLMVCKEDFEQRHPSDFLRVSKEKIAVDWVRPNPPEETFLPSCTTQGRSGISGYGTAGCMRPSVPFPENVSLDNFPTFCTINSVQPLADIAWADCATVGLN